MKLKIILAIIIAVIGLLYHSRHAVVSVREPAVYPTPYPMRLHGFFLDDGKKICEVYRYDNMEIKIECYKR